MFMQCKHNTTSLHRSDGVSEQQTLVFACIGWQRRLSVTLRPFYIQSARTCHAQSQTETLAHQNIKTHVVEYLLNLLQSLINDTVARCYNDSLHLLLLTSVPVVVPVGARLENKRRCSRRDRAVYFYNFSSNNPANKCILYCYSIQRSFASVQDVFSAVLSRVRAFRVYSRPSFMVFSMSVFLCKSRS